MSAPVAIQPPAKPAYTATPKNSWEKDKAPIATYELQPKDTISSYQDDSKWWTFGPTQRDVKK